MSLVDKVQTCNKLLRELEIHNQPCYGAPNAWGTYLIDSILQLRKPVTHSGGIGSDATTVKAGEELGGASRDQRQVRAPR